MKNFIVIFCLLLASCNIQNETASSIKLTSEDRLLLSIQGKWTGFNDAPIWEIRNDTFYFNSGDLKAMVFKSPSKNSTNIAETFFEQRKKKNIFSDAFKDKILGKWGYSYKAGSFTWIFTQDSVYYVELAERYSYVLHENNVMVLTDGNPAIMKEIILTNDTFSFETSDKSTIRAHRLE